MRKPKPFTPPAGTNEGHFVGPVDLTHWQTAAGQELVHQHRRLTERFGPQGALIVSLTVGGLIAVGATFATTRIYDSVLGRRGIASLDEPALNLAKKLRSPIVNGAAAGIARLFGPIAMPILSIGAAAALAAHQRRRTPAIIMVAAGLGSLAMTITGKDIIHRHRPPRSDAIPPYETSPSFPSGHTLNATTILGALSYLMVTTQTRRRTQTLTITSAAATAVTVGLSRVLLGAHWLTDVAVGWVSGTGWLALIITSHRLYLTTRHTGTNPQ